MTESNTESPKTSVLDELLKALADTIVEGAGAEFRTWVAGSDAPKSVKAQFNEVADDLNDAGLGIIALCATQWTRQRLDEK